MIDINLTKPSTRNQAHIYLTHSAILVTLKGHRTLGTTLSFGLQPTKHDQSEIGRSDTQTHNRTSALLDPRHALIVSSEHRPFGHGINIDRRRSVDTLALCLSLSKKA